MYKVLFFWLLAMIFWRCANPTPLTGGAKDATPPRLDSVRYSTPNGSTNFREDEIILSFDEWIVLEKAQQRILISPPLQEKPTYKIKHKSLIIKFKESLKENTTYTINFGEAIKDLAEGNVAKNFKFVFSTGEKLDSLRVSGQIVSAETGKGVNNVAVMLYTDRRDSVLYQDKPYYVTRTTESGQFLIENVKADSFKIVALADKNDNYVLDLPNEEIAFWPSDFPVNDTSQPFIQMRLFQPISVLQVSSARMLGYGSIKAQFNQKPETIRVECLNPPTNYRQKIDLQADSAKIWFDGDFVQNQNLRWLVHTADRTDTLEFLVGNRDTALKYFTPLAFTAVDTGSAQPSGMGMGKSGGARKKSAAGKLHPEKPHVSSFPRLLSAIDTQKIVVQDSLKTRIAARFQLDSTLFQLETRAAWLPATKYQLVLLPGAVTDFWGIANRDTLRQTVEVAKAEDFGNIKLKITHADSAASYFVQLVRDGEVLESQFFITNADSILQTYSRLEPAAYTVRVIHDRNQNRRWDTGDYLGKRQPERISNSSPVQVRANWDNELELDINPPKERNAGTLNTGNNKKKRG